MLPTQLSPTLHVQHDPSPGLDNEDQTRLHATPDASATAQGGSILNRRRGVSLSPAPTQLERRAVATGVTLEAYYERMVLDSRIPLGRVGRAEEFADLASFLLSSRSSYITGAGINLDGGLCPVP